MKETLNKPTLTFIYERCADGKINISVVSPAGEIFSMAIWPREADDRNRFINELCAKCPGLMSEREEIRKQLLQIARATEIDIRFNTHGPINGRASCSARLWSGPNILDTDSLNLMSFSQREKAIKHLAGRYVGPRASTRKLEATERNVRALFMGELERVLKEQSTKATSRTTAHYVADASGIFLKKGDKEEQLTNFTARIIADVNRSDGVESERLLEVEVSQYGEAPERCAMTVAEFEKMKWPMSRFGPGYWVTAGVAAADKARVAIQTLSADPAPAKRRVYRNTGWTEDFTGFLHAGGKRTSEGDAPSVNVDLDSQLKNFILPSRPDSAGLKACIHASLGLLKAAPSHLTYPLYCGVWRALIGTCDLSMFSVGITGTYKSSVNALMQQHVGAAMERTNLPANWAATSNALGAIAFHAKNMPLVIDDLVPADKAANAKALVVMRSAGNAAGKSRLNRECELRPDKPPRALLFVTGEDLPFGSESIYERLVIVRFGVGDIPHASSLSAFQHDARQGLYSGAAAGFIGWLCENDRIKSLHAKLQSTEEDLSREFGFRGAHARAPMNLARLAAGLRAFLDFAQDVGAIGAVDYQRLWQDGWNALRQTGDRQMSDRHEQRPVIRFLQAVGSAISSGRAHIATGDGQQPTTYPDAYGWRETAASFRVAQGDRIGWIKDGELLINLDSAIRVALFVLGQDALPSRAAIGRELEQRGLLLECDPRRFTTRRMVAGKYGPVTALSPQAVEIMGLPAGALP